MHTSCTRLAALFTLVACFTVPVEASRCKGGSCDASDADHPDAAAAQAFKTTTPEQAYGIVFGNGVSFSKFFKSHWETSPVLIHRGAATFRPILTLSMLDFIVNTSLSAYEPGAPMGDQDIKVVRRTRGKDGDWWTGGLPLKSFSLAELHSAFESGFSFIMNKVNYRWGPVSQLCKLLSAKVFGFRVAANLYATPGRAQGFEAHFDWMESIVLQIEGSKRWKLYDSPTHIPFAYQKVKVKASELDAPSEEVVLSPGDVLYLPSGLIHEAEVTGAQPSLHLTIGVEVDPIFTWAGFLHFALDQTPLQHSFACQSDFWPALQHAAVDIVANDTLSYPLRKSVLYLIASRASLRSQFKELRDFLCTRAVFSKVLERVDSFLAESKSLLDEFPHWQQLRSFKYSACLYTVSRKEFRQSLLVQLSTDHFHRALPVFEKAAKASVVRGLADEQSFMNINRKRMDAQLSELM